MSETMPIHVWFMFYARTPYFWQIIIENNYHKFYFYVVIFILVSVGRIIKTIADSFAEWLTLLNICRATRRRIMWNRTRI